MVMVQLESNYYCISVIIGISIDQHSYSYALKLRPFPLWAVYLGGVKNRSLVSHVVETP